MAAVDLCTLVDVKAWLAIGDATTGQDPVIDRVINATSADFLREIERPDFYPATDYIEVREGDGANRLVLRHWPINSIASVSVNGTPLAASADKVQPGYSIDDDIDPERLWELYLVGSAFTDGAVVVVAYNAGYLVVPHDVVQAVIEWSSVRYKSRQWIGQTSKHMVQGETVQTPEMEIPSSVRRVIDRYRRHSVLDTPMDQQQPANQQTKGRK